MRGPATILVLSMATGIASAGPVKLPAAAPVPNLFVADPTHPDVALTEAALHLELHVAADARPYMQFFWWSGVPDGYLERVLTLWKTYLQTVSSASAYVRPAVIEGTGGRLWVLDIRTARWVRAAISSVVHGDHVFVEPAVDHKLADRVRRLIGVEQDPKTFHAEAVVWGPWFLREIMETEGRSEAYYALLYAVERFGDDKASPLPPGFRPYNAVLTADCDVVDARRAVVKPLGKGSGFQVTSSPNEYGYVYGKTAAGTEGFVLASALSPIEERKAGGSGLVDKNFPRDFDDWAAKWGIAEAEKFLAKERLFVKNGEVIAGAKSDPRRGSYVAYQDRVIEFLPVTTRSAGAIAMRTRDFLKTAARGNVANQPREVALGLVEEDLGEHLVTLPNGFQATLLTGSAKQGRKRAEFGDTRAVRSSLDPHDVVIRIQFSCTVCHGPESGIIPPSNRKVRESLERATNLLAKYPDDRDAIESFFVGWDANLEVWRLPLRVGLLSVTASAADPKGWSGARWAAETLAFRDWYDQPVTLDLAAAELGYPRLAVALAALLEGSDTYDATALFMGAGVPRSVWDNDLAPKLSLILSFARQVDSGDVLYDVWCAGLALQARKGK